MTSIALEYAREDAKTIIKASMELMNSIDAYTDEGLRIVGKQEASITGGNGAKLTVDVPEMQEHDDKTVVEVNAEKNVSIDMATDPEDIKSEFLTIINDVRQKGVDGLLDEMSQEMSPKESKEVASSKNFGDNQSVMGKRFIIIFVVFMIFSIIFGLVMTAMMMP